MTVSVDFIQVQTHKTCEVHVHTQVNINQVFTQHWITWHSKNKYDFTKIQTKQNKYCTQNSSHLTYIF